MAKTVYNGFGTYLIYAEDTAFGTAGVPAGGAYVDKTATTSYTITNNLIRVHGIGEGRDATKVVSGGLDVTGSTETEFTDPDFLQYCVIGLRTGAGTIASPHQISEVEALGYAATEVNTLTLEVGATGTTADVMTFDGAAVNSWTLSGNVDESVKMNFDWVCRQGTSSTSSETYVPPANRPLVWTESTLTLGGETVGEVTAFEITSENNLGIYRTMGSRLINQPQAGVRRYDFSITAKLHSDDAASTVSGTELRSLAMAGDLTSVACADIGGWAGKALSFIISEGGVSGDRVVSFKFENAFIESFNPTFATEDSTIEVSVAGFFLAGLEDSGSKVPIEWYTVA